ncbi:maleylpyruvate isomerase family mycothiol-dependent enzyme [Salinactinospora qingdaonensis]|uniref:Mycothiol-dependent maleylpyruvate isomerase NagL n=1 Tax=Salinactinospora qingdaonensis TaxID=702744 RepID=A0ABP7FI67_9ACTN
MEQPTSAQVDRWIHKGTKLFADAIAELADAEFRAPSLLPGWTRAHVIAHVVGNAKALLNLLTWARTGVETPMYASDEARATEIEERAQEPPEWLRAEFAASARELDDGLAALAPEHLDRPLHTRQGTSVTARQVPWLRTGELWLHLVDLDIGHTCADFPTDLVDALLARVTADRSAARSCPWLLLAPTDREREWEVTSGTTASSPVRVTGTAAEVLAWLTGRSTGSGLHTDSGGVPALPAWL